MSNPLTDAPASVLPAVQFAPDIASLTPRRYADALAALTTYTLFLIDTFQFIGPLVASVRHEINPNDAFAVFPFGMPGDGEVLFRLDVGTVPAAYADQFVACWVIDQDGNTVYRANVPVGGPHAGRAVVAGGNCAFVLRLGRANPVTAPASGVGEAAGLLNSDWNGNAEVSSGDSLTAAGTGRDLAYGDQVWLWGTGGLYDGRHTVLQPTSHNSFVIDADYLGSATGTLVLPDDFAGLAPVECSLAASYRLSD